MRVPEEGLRFLLEVSKHSFRKYLKYDDMFTYAAALAYRVLFAIVPFLALLIALPWFFGIGGFFVEWLSDQTSAASQGPIAGVVGEWIKQSQYHSQGGWLTIGIVIIGISVWTVSSGIRTLTKALNAAYDVE